MKHIMLDLETMGHGAGAAIVQIGAVEFNVKDGPGERFTVNVDLASCMAAGLHCDGDTIMWWMRQSGEARKSICLPEGVPLTKALQGFANFVNRCKAQYVWGNGSTFDNAILRAAYDAIDLACPWHFRGDRDMRTVVDIAKGLGLRDKLVEPERIGPKHDGLADAHYQAMIVVQILNRLRCE